MTRPIDQIRKADNQITNNKLEICNAFNDYYSILRDEYAKQIAEPVDFD